MSVRVQEADFDCGTETAALYEGCHDVGAVATFVGVVRADPGGRGAVSSMTLEHYPGMTEKALEDIVAEARRRWPAISAVRVVHRVGRLAAGDRIVFAGVAGVHRGEAFAACEFIMDYLKTRAPFWKKEETPDGGRWVDARESDDVAAGRWETPR